MQDTEHLTRELSSTRDLYEAMVKFLLQVRRMETLADRSLFPFDVVERLFFQFHGYDRPIPIDVSTIAAAAAAAAARDEVPREGEESSNAETAPESPPESDDGPVLDDPESTEGDQGQQEDFAAESTDGLDEERPFDWSNENDEYATVDSAVTVEETRVTVDGVGLEPDSSVTSDDQRISSTS